MLPSEPSQSKSLQMGEAYAAYASALAQRMAQFLRATRLRVKPSADFVSCACAGREHFVPASALDAHLVWKKETHTRSHSLALLVLMYTAFACT
jgi:hypothetical protein